METPCTFNIYRTWNPTNVEEASSMIYLPYDGCWILYNCMELCALIKVLIYISTLENHRKAGIGKSSHQSFLFI